MTREDVALINSEAGRKFLHTYAGAELQKLILNPPTKEFPEVAERIGLFVDQLTSQRKAKKKLPVWHRTPGIVYPPPLSLEQSSSEETARYKKGLIRGEVLVDLTGGMGIDCSTLAGQFKEVHYVERSSDLCAVFRHNAVLLGLNHVVIHQEEATAFAKHWATRDEVCFFLDPARRADNNQKVFRFGDCEPNAAELLPTLLDKGKSVLIKASPMLDLKLGLSELQQIAEVHVLAIRNELKEVLFLAKPGWTEEPVIRTLNLADLNQPFDFRLSEEETAQASIGPLGRYLYEPHVAVLKAGAFKLISERYSLTKLDVNSHLYTSEEFVPTFPGKTFEVIGELSKQSLKKHVPTGKANIIARNYPLTPEQIKKKYKLKDGGDEYVIGTKNAGKPRLVVGRLIPSGQTPMTRLDGE